MKQCIVVASHNPVKIEAVLNGFRRMFPQETYQINPVSVESGVSDQPMSDADALHGALTRAQNARQIVPEGAFWVGVEGGCGYQDAEMVAFAWVVILTKQKQGSARTAQFRIPPTVQHLVETGMELGDADDQVFGKDNSKQKSGAVGLLTADVVTRKSLYEQAVILALIPFKNLALY